MDEKVVTKPDCMTTFESYSIEYEWQISKVSGRTSKGQALVCPEELKSPPGKKPSTTWRLEALQHSYSPNNKLLEVYNVTLTLVSCSCTTVWASVKLETKVKNHWSSTSVEYSKMSLNVSPSHKEPQTYQIYKGRSFTGFIPRQNLFQFTINEDLIIHCHIFVNKLEEPVHVVNSPTNEVKAPTFDLCTLMEEARHNDRYTDIMLLTEGKQFKAHKVVLATQSSFFATRFEKRWEKDSGNKIDMLDVPADTMDAILTYMYTGKVVNIDKKAYDLLPKAEEYNLEGLKTMCEEALTKSLIAETAIDILQLASTHNAQNLKESCLAFIAKNITEVKESLAWITWAKEKPEERTNKDLWLEMLEYIVKSL